MKSLSNPSPKISKWLMQLAEFCVEINYKQGKLNSNADVLTRKSVNDVRIFNLSSELSSETIHDEKQREPTLKKYATSWTAKIAL